MKVISLLQPWATLVVIGAKRIETRSWDTKYRGPIAIHASKGLSKAQRAICKQEKFADALAEINELPLGKIIGAVTLHSTFKSEDFPTAFGAKAQALEYGPTTAHAIVGGMREHEFGDFSPGRFGWDLRDPISFVHPIDVRGSLGIWNFPLCRKCGCWQQDCRGCIEKTGYPCSWVEEDLCSACVPEVYGKAAENIPETD